MNNNRVGQGETPLRVIISGGGTGGHIFPAISIANAIKELRPDAEILFVGAEGRMEMQRVPDAGYKIIGLPISGFDRKRIWRNFAVLIKLVRSQRKARSIIKEFRPQVVVGVGGYASGPTLKTAQMMDVPTLIQEQNSYAGVTNKLLAQKANLICVAYQGMEKFFPKEKIRMTGNPVRQNLSEQSVAREEAARSFGLDPAKKTILVLGGSLGAHTINCSMIEGTSLLYQSLDKVQFIWQIGSRNYEHMKEIIDKEGGLGNTYATDFIKDMAAAYAAADLVISRAGASSISELCLLRKPVILIPSPNVAEDHQTKNAMALANKGAAICLTDAEATQQMMPLAIKTVSDSDKLQELSSNIAKLALPNSATVIAKEVIGLAEAKTPKS